MDLEDKIEADVQSVIQSVAPKPAGTLGAQSQPSASIASIATPEAAMIALRDKVGVMHKLVHDASHVGSLAVTEVEHLVSDVKFLLAYIHTKV